MKKQLWLAGILLIASVTTAQSAKVTEAQDKGLYGVVNYESSKDGSLGWTAESDYTAGYQFNQHFSSEIGIPVWLVATTESTSTSGTTRQKTKSGLLGDVFLRFNLDPKFKSFGYHTSLTGTAPTGNTNYGLSTGRAGVTWNNHFEKDLGMVTPFGEAGLSNMQGSSKYFHRSYTVLGRSAGFRGGASADLSHRFSVEASAYDVAPFGTQKIYSRLVPRKSSGVVAGVSKKGRPFATQAVTIGSATIAADHGFGAGMSFDPSKRFSLGMDYNHSIVQALDSVGFNVSYRFGHVSGEKPARY